MDEFNHPLNTVSSYKDYKQMSKKGIDWSKECFFQGIRRPELHDKAKCSVCKKKKV